MPYVTNKRSRRKALIRATGLALCCSAALSVGAAERFSLPGLSDNQYSGFIVKYRDGEANSVARTVTTRTDARLARINAMMQRLERAAARALPAGASGRSLRMKHLRRLAMHAELIEANRPLDRVEAAALMRQIELDPNVEYVQPNHIYHTTATPNDTRYVEQWHYLANAAGANLPDAWDRSTGEGVVVAVVDSGIADHDDLRGNVLPGYDMVSSVNGATAFQCMMQGQPANCRLGASDDGNGRDNDPTDLGQGTSFHGTHVAGTIAAVSNNDRGVAGVAYGARVVPVRAMGRGGSGNTADIVDAISWAAGLDVDNAPRNPNPAEVINLSLGGPRACDRAEQDAIDAAIAAGSIVVVAAGNSNVDVSQFAPANCQGVITVAASDNQTDRAWYSNYGDGIDITAPGGETEGCSRRDFIDMPVSELVAMAQSDRQRFDAFCGFVEHPEQGVLSTVDGNGFGFMAGTSMAAPHVAGVVALAQSAAVAAGGAPLTTVQMLAALTETARPIPTARCPGGCGAGLIDAEAVVARVAPAAPEPEPDPVADVPQTYTNTRDYPIADNSTIQSPIVVAGRNGNASSETGIVVSLAHGRPADLRLQLTAPDGRRYNLPIREGRDIRNLRYVGDFSERPASGTWTLWVTDQVAGVTGQLSSWSIEY